MLIKPIGKGSFGLVWKAKILSGPKKNENVAIKIVNLDGYKADNLEEARVIYTKYYVDVRMKLSNCQSANIQIFWLFILLLYLARMHGS
jgi:hypothetical protein